MLKGAFLLISCAALMGCGFGWPPVAESSAQLSTLPAGTMAIRARGLSDEDIPALGRFRELADLTFYSGWAVMENRLTDKGVENLAALALPRLDTLFLGPDLHLTDRSISYLLDMKTVRVLGLPGCPGITNGGLALLSGMDWLEHLDLRGNGGFDDQGLLKLGSMKSLKRLVLDGAPNITPQGVESLKTALPGCRISNDEESWKMTLGDHASMNPPPRR